MAGKKKAQAKTKKQAKKAKPAKRSRKKATRSAKRKVAKPASSKPSSTLAIAVTLPSSEGSLARGLGPTKFGARMTASMSSEFQPEPTVRQNAISELQRLGFEVSAQGRLSVSVRGSKSLFEKVFGTKLSRFEATSPNAQRDSFYYPADDAPWSPHAGLSSLIDDAYIQWPHIYMNDVFKSSAPSPIPPRVDYHHLRVAGDLTWLLNVDRVHREGTTGRGVRVAMIDSGFAHAAHPYFARRGYRTSTVLAPGANQPDKDGSSHGTGESANLLAIAPDVTFVGVKLDNEGTGRGASILEGLHEAIRHEPQVISVSLGFDLRGLSSLPNSLKALEAEIQAAVAAGTIIVFSAGNGHVAFPGMMPEVISAGGAFVDQDGSLQASNYSSGFVSDIYLNRVVPDFCGLVGMLPDANYIMLPVQAKSEMDKRNDGTAKDDGWGVFSGTSAAAPQLAGVCALLLQKNPGLTPGDLKSVIRRTAVDVTQGRANKSSSSTPNGEPAKTGEDSATGAGLVDAFEAWRQV